MYFQFVYGGGRRRYGGAGKNSHDINAHFGPNPITL